MTHRPVRTVGEQALLVECADLAEAIALHEAVTAAPLPGQVGARLGARTVLVELGSPGSRRAATAALALVDPAAPGRTDSGRVVRVEVVYDGPDLDPVAAAMGLSRAALVARHAATTWVAAFGGFAPGFTYLAGDGPPVARRATPRTRVPAGSVAVADTFSAVYPSASPGGWQLLGRTGAQLWDPDRAAPSLLRPGDRVEFRAVREVVVAAATSPPDRSGAADLIVLEPGPLTLVEDQGRPGLAALGVPPSGVADRGAAARANRLVGNPRTAAVLETLGGLVLGSERDVVVAVTGAPGGLTRTGPDLPADSPEPETAVRLVAGTELHVAPPVAGRRRYVAVRGGLSLAPVLGSRSTDLLSGLGPPPLSAGSRLTVGEDPGTAVGDAEVPPLVTGLPLTVPLVWGPRQDWFTPAGRAALTATAWEVGEASNRVGLRLHGGRVAAATDGELPSEPVVTGAVQVPPSGHPVVLLVDHPVTGGYPVIGVVPRRHLDLLAQAAPGQVLRFVPVRAAQSSVPYSQCHGSSGPTPPGAM